MKILSFILIGLTLNIILSFILIKWAFAGHSTILLFTAFLLPFFAIFCYLIYIKLYKILKKGNKKILLFSFAPSLYISILILVLMTFFFFYFGANDFIGHYRFSLIITFIIVVPNLIFQFFIYLSIIKFFRKKFFSSDDLNLTHD